MSIINNKKPEHADIQDVLNGQVLINRVKDEDGNTTGFHTIDPEHFKWFAENYTEEQLDRFGYDTPKRKNLVAWIKNHSKVIAKKPEDID